MYKKLDLHVKLPRPAKGIEYRHVDDSQKILVDHLIQHNFYEIESFAGNRIFTIQLSSAKFARSLFKQSSAWSTRYGGVASLNLETCLWFWQRPETAGQPRPSPIPPVWTLEGVK